jgi:glycosyltransferase involved in cell wall biosynthesis
MRISVIIPTHNRASTLPRALDSVLKQTRPADEIIVVDDGSNDATATLIAQDYPAMRYLHQPNRGVSSARNLGIAHSSGDWIALLDSDDTWLPDKLLRQAEALKGHPGMRICHTEEIWVRNGVRVNPMRKHEKQGGRIFQRCLPLCVISPSSVMLHRTLFLEYGNFDIELPACEDYDLWLRLCAHEEVLFIEQPLIVKYGGHDDQLSRRYWGMDRFRVKALQKMLCDSQLNDADRRATLAALAEKAGIIAQGAEKRNQLTRAAHYRRIESDCQSQLNAYDT